MGQRWLGKRAPWKNSRSSSLEENIRIIENELELLEKEKIELMEFIDSFSGADNQIVKLKYIEDMDVYDIADETGYSVSYIRKRHTEIRKTLSFVDEYESRREERLKKQEEMDYYSADQDQLSLFWHCHKMRPQSLCIFLDLNGL